MIYTFTLNPAVDYFLTINGDLMIDEVNRGTDEFFKAGGKGLNVSKVLSLLRIPSKAVALLGGFTGNYITDQFVGNPYVEIVPVRVSGANRINLKAHYDHKALCINGQGPTADEVAKQQLLGIVKAVKEEDTVVISGSMMSGLDEEFLILMADITHEKGAALVIDMEKITPEVLRRCRPSLIKPNLYELQLLMQDMSITKETAPEALTKLRSEGVETILLSLGKDGALLADKDGFLYLTQPATPLVNKVGAGDAMLAAFLGKRTQGADREESLRYGGAAGNAVASQLEDITAETIDHFLPLMGTRK